jgi:hypothetical protein
VACTMPGFRISNRYHFTECVYDKYGRPQVPQSVFDTSLPAIEQDFLNSARTLCAPCVVMGSPSVFWLVEPETGGGCVLEISVDFRCGERPKPKWEIILDAVLDGLLIAFRTIVIYEVLIIGGVKMMTVSSSTQARTFAKSLAKQLVH